MLVMANVDVPLLVNVTTLATLVVPTGWLPKSKLVLDRLRAGPEGVPVPIKLITCGLPPALSVMMIVPARVPMAVGAKLILIVQLAPFGTLPPQLSVRVKSPLGSILVMVNVAFPVLVSVTVFGALIEPSGCPSKVRLRGDSITAGPVSMALPVRLTICGLSAALSVIVTIPVRRPGIVGVKMTLIVQLAPAARLLPQLLVEKFKLAAMPSIGRIRVALPLFVSVTGIGRLLVPTVWLPVNVRLGGASVTTGAAPVPVRVIVRGLPLPLSVIMIAPVLVPRAVGLKVTLMVQLAPAATLVPFLQVVPGAGAKSPLGSTLVMVKVVPLPLFNVSVCAGLVVPTNWSAKIRIVLDREMPGAKPIPVRVITGTLPRASLVMATPPVLKPVAVGVKVALIVQLAPTARLVPQLFVCANSPLAAMLALVNTAVPLV